MSSSTLRTIFTDLDPSIMDQLRYPGSVLQAFSLLEVRRRRGALLSVMSRILGKHREMWSDLARSASDPRFTPRHLVPLSLDGITYMIYIDAEDSWTLDEVPPSTRAYLARTEQGSFVLFRNDVVTEVSVQRPRSGVTQELLHNLLREGHANEDGGDEADPVVPAPVKSDSVRLKKKEVNRVESAQVDAGTGKVRSVSAFIDGISRQEVLRDHVRRIVGRDDGDAESLMTAIAHCFWDRGFVKDDTSEEYIQSGPLREIHDAVRSPRREGRLGTEAVGWKAYNVLLARVGTVEPAEAALIDDLQNDAQADIARRIVEILKAAGEIADEEESIFDIAGLHPGMEEGAEDGQAGGDLIFRHRSPSILAWFNSDGKRIHPGADGSG